MIENREIGTRWRELLKQAPDLARAISRLSLNRGGPRDLLAVRDCLAVASTLSNELSSLELPDELRDALTALAAAPDMLADHLQTALSDDVPLLSRDGGFVRSGYDSELDELRQLRDESKRVIAAMQAELVEETGVKSLKIKHNNVLGYFIEVGSNHS